MLYLFKLLLKIIWIPVYLVLTFPSFIIEMLDVIFKPLTNVAKMPSELMKELKLNSNDFDSFSFLIVLTLIATFIVALIVGILCIIPRIGSIPFGAIKWIEHSFSHFKTFNKLNQEY